MFDEELLPAILHDLGLDEPQRGPTFEEALVALYDREETIENRD